MKLAQVHVLHNDKLADAGECFYVIRDVFVLRRGELCGLFQQRRLDLSQEIHEFSCGIFSTGHLPLTELGPQADTASYVYDFTDDVLPNTNILKYPPHFEHFYPAQGLEDGLDDRNGSNNIHQQNVMVLNVVLGYLAKYSKTTKYSKYIKTNGLGQDHGPLQQIVGHWTGVLDRVNADAGLAMINLHFTPSSTSNNQVIASPRLYYPWRCTRTTIVGEPITSSEDEPAFAFTVTFNCDTAELPTEYLRLTLGQDGTTLVGDHDVAPDFSSPFRSHAVFKKDVPPSVMAFYASPQQLKENRLKAWWHFAIQSILGSKVESKTMSWKRVKALLDRRHRLASLLYCQMFVDELHPEDADEQCRLLHRISPAELHLLTYALVESEKYYHRFLPPCSGGVSRSCGKVLKTAVPMLRCCTCPPEAGYRRPMFDASFCNDNPDCLEKHVRDKQQIHCIVKTRIPGWSMGEEGKARERKLSDLLARLEDVTETLARPKGTRADTSSPFRRASVDKKMWESIPSLNGKTTPDSMDTPEEVDEGSSSSLHEDHLASEESLDGSVEDEHIARTAADLRFKHVGLHTPPRSDMSLSIVHSDTDSLLEGSPLANPANPTPIVKPYCIGCEEEVHMPCWLCVECSDTLFVCLACDEKGGIEAVQHKGTHALARVYDNQAAESTTLKSALKTSSRPQRAHSGVRWGNVRDGDGGVRWGNVGDDETDADASSGPGDSYDKGEASLADMETRFTTMEDRIGGLEDGLGRIEKMLERLLTPSRLRPGRSLPGTASPI
ncbi:hypothetical protein BD311DRAFT_869526 [Dichomitus squalens]|uniref:ZZ-type domain-containing protein n=1 Tax=Dichomitus squalens TaxID=114155 RepID=A0A4Q9M5M0_9APHY|nr:hypothetical protein BD311DRAFT_869526 [Dichomitus squalens]